jgi:hypothetical protein
MEGEFADPLFGKNIRLEKGIGSYGYKAGFCNGPRFVNPSCVIQSPARASVRGRRMAAT